MRVGLQLSSQVNHAAAAQLKSTWTPSVNIWTAFGNTTRDLFFTELHESLDPDAALKATDFEELERHYEARRDKVSEIIVVRSLARPLPANETRISLVNKACDAAKSLDATLPAPLALLVARLKGDAA